MPTKRSSVPPARPAASRGTARQAAAKPGKAAPPPVPHRAGGGAQSTTQSSDALAKLIAPEESNSLAAVAKKLRDEQIRAKVTYFAPDQETNSELDAITAAVIAELHAIQTAGAAAAARARPTDTAHELSRHLRIFLDKLLSTRRKAFLKRKIEEIQRRITALFFNSALFAKMESGAPQEIEVSYADQAMFYALKRHETSIIADLHLLKYDNLETREEEIARLKQFEKELRMGFLSRTTPELEKVLEIFRDVLVVFFRQFRKELAGFCDEVIAESGVAASAAVGYKIGEGSFGHFREAFEKKFLYALVRGIQEPVAQRSSELREQFRRDTVEFMGDPQIFTEICSVMCDASYEYLFGEGFLDLPVDWRARLERENV